MAEQSQIPLSFGNARLVHAELSRAETLSKLSLPSTMVRGTEDPCNLPELLDPYVTRSDFALPLVEGVDHGFQHVGGPHAEARAIAEVADLVANWAASQV